MQTNDCTCKGEPGLFGYRPDPDCPVHAAPPPERFENEMIELLKRMYPEAVPMEFVLVAAMITDEGEAVEYEVLTSASPPHAVVGLLRMAEAFHEKEKDDS